MKYDDFLVYLFTKSTLANTTKNIYMQWVTRCCQYYHKQHLLDIAPQELDDFRLHLLQDKCYSHASDTIVYNAFKHTYRVLLPLVDAEAAKRYQRLFQHAPRQPKKLPTYVSQDDMQRFLQALPLTIVGHIIKEIYRTSAPFETHAATWKCSKAYCQAVCAKTAREVNIQHGFGLTGVRGVSIIHRIQNRRNDNELAEIQQDSGMSNVQFEKYLQVAGFYGENVCCSLSLP